MIGVARKLGVHRRMVREAVRSAVPAQRKKTERPAVKMAAAAATLIDVILESDRKAPRKQRHTARRIFDRIRAEVRGCTPAARTVRQYVERRKRELGLAERETFVPSLQREVDSLSKAGILAQWRDGRRAYFKADTASPVFPDLRALFEKTAGLLPILQQELDSLGERIQLGFLYGSIARSQETLESDVDLMIVGTAGLSDLVPSLRRAEQALSRPVNPTVFSREEFQRKAKHHDHFLSAVLQGPKTFVKGGERELEAMAWVPLRKKADVLKPVAVRQILCRDAAHYRAIDIPS